jgi:hypothetical protein
MKNPLPMKTLTELAGIVLLAFLMINPIAPVQARQSDEPLLNITAIDPTGHPSIVRLKVLVQEADKRFIVDPEAQFQIHEEASTPVAATVQRYPSPNHVVVVLDLYEQLGQERVSQISQISERFFTRLFSQPPEWPGIGFVTSVIVPGNAQTNQQQVDQIDNFSSLNMQVAEGIAARDQRPKGATVLADAIRTALEMTPQAIIVLSSAESRSTNPTLSADLAAQLQNSDEATPVYWLEPTDGDTEQPADLVQLLESSGGKWPATPSDQQLDTLVNQLRTRASPAYYELQYEPPQAGGATPIIFDLKLTLQDGRNAQEQDNYSLPDSIWDEQTAYLELEQVEDYMLPSKPDAEHARFTFEGRAADIAFRRPTLAPTLTLNLQAPDGQIFEVVGQIEIESSMALAGESVAVVLDLKQDDIDTRFAQLIDALSALQDTEQVFSRMAVFLPLPPDVAETQPDWETFTLDHGSLRNMTTLSETELPVDNTALHDAILHAIEQANADGDAHAHPAQVIILTGTPIADQYYLRLANEARRLGVAIHTLALGEADLHPYETLSKATRGEFVRNSDPEPLTSIAKEIEQARPLQLQGHAFSPIAANDGQVMVSLQEYPAEPLTMRAFIPETPPSIRSYRILVLGISIVLLTGVTFFGLRYWLEQAPVAVPPAPVGTGTKALPVANSDPAMMPPPKPGMPSPDPCKTFSTERHQCLEILFKRGERLIDVHSKKQMELEENQ